MNTFDRVTEYCKYIKELAKTFKTFDNFFDIVQTTEKNQKVLKPSDFKRLIQVAAVEANLA